MKKVVYYDHIIVGAGIVGLTIARELIRRDSKQTVLLIDKELQLGCHGSGRNSGVLHSGIYYREGTLKAKACAAGRTAMTEYCLQNGLPVHKIGKVIVPIKPEHDAQVDLLLTRAKTNLAKASIIDSKQLNDIEPEAYTASGRALYSPETAVVDPKAVLECLYQELLRLGVTIKFNTPFRSAKPEESMITAGDKQYQYGFLYNSAGQYADVVAKQFGLAGQYTLLPFKGIYYQLDPQADIQINGLIYPVPDLNVPFLGVHTVKNIQGEHYFGPTAVPALGREHYYGLRGIKLKDAAQISYHLLGQYWQNQQGFRRFVHAEAGRYFKSSFAKAARALVPRLKAKQLLTCDKVGIRAQLFDKKKQQLVKDFLIERTDNTLHVLNAISPAFTCSLYFAKYIVDLISQKEGAYV